MVSGPSYHDNAGRGIDDYDCFRSIAVTNDYCCVNNASSSSRVGNGDDNHFRLIFLIARQHAMHAELDIVLPTVRLSRVCLSNAGVVSKRMEISSHFLTFW